MCEVDDWFYIIIDYEEDDSYVIVFILNVFWVKEVGNIDGEVWCMVDKYCYLYNNICYYYM